ncbi:hypothetical protein OG317_16295 [Streptomyces sp. NBC_01167]|uniref:hypothetical protein n=1 Tax=Streptomyces sp. NBC_01167 TaxID=2903756 RepID=UPI0038649969|nr:hypothetical protein OG317_16295 [Streptomyces sp. NBC_01167]
MTRVRIATTALVLSGALLVGAPVASASPTPTAVTAVQKPGSAPQAGTSSTVAQAGIETSTVDKARKSKKKKKKSKGFGAGLIIGLIIIVALIVIIALLVQRRKKQTG